MGYFIVGQEPDVKPAMAITKPVDEGEEVTKILMAPLPPFEVACVKNVIALHFKESDLIRDDESLVQMLNYFSQLKIKGAVEPIAIMIRWMIEQNKPKPKDENS